MEVHFHNLIKLRRYKASVGDNVTSFTGMREIMFEKGQMQSWRKTRMRKKQWKQMIR
jgi:hypothetical protein